MTAVELAAISGLQSPISLNFLVFVQLLLLAIIVTVANDGPWGRNR